jgi:hypothetical protein
MKSVGKPDAGNPHVRFDERGRETGRLQVLKPPRPSSTLLFRFHRWLANLRVLEVEEMKSVPCAPLSHPFVERLIGTIRREYFDQVFFWNAADLARKLNDYKIYYNAHRVHRSLGGSTPALRAGAPSAVPAPLDHHAWRPHCRGLFQTPIAA